MKITFPALLFVVFLVLRLCHVIAWSWLWVTCPLWAGLAIWAACVGLVVLVAGVAFVASEIERVVRKRRAR